jgi:ATP-dependent DNA helicase RecG
MAKSALSIGLGQKEISGQLNKVIRQLLANKIIKFTIPERPKSRLQKYQLTAKGKELLEKWRTSQ